MRIEELEPKVSVTTMLSMLCPVCKRHKVSVPLGPGQWSWDGSTLTPSIQFEGGYSGHNNESLLCKGHFTVTNGQVNLC